MEKQTAAGRDANKKIEMKNTDIYAQSEKRTYV